MSQLFTFHLKKTLYDLMLWIILIFSLFFLSVSDLIAQCNCDDELVTTTSINSSEGFESYSANQPIPIGGNWSLFPNAGVIPATVVNSPTNCGSRSLKFQYNNGSAVDMNYLIDEKRTSFKMYVPANKTAQFSYLLGDGTTSHFDIDFNANGSAFLSNGESFTYPLSTWFRFSIIKVNNEFKFL
ncbi:MAG: hypothetical protein IPO92_16470 [Saprospiraceae bacterium]|nr:hypothetical protein [Saprospiraceae bacterium]